MAGAEEGRVAQERDLYRALVELPSGDTSVWLGGVLNKLLQVTQAERGYVELYDSADRRRMAVSHGCSTEQEEEIRSVTSRGIVAEAIASGDTVHTPFALLDERFANQPSVQRQRLEAVLCVPLAGTNPGVLYLEAKRGAGGFSPEVVALAERVAGFLAPTLDRSVPRWDVDPASDPTAAVRKKLRLDGLVGRSAALAQVLEHVAAVAPLDITVLLTGESGTGKTQLARAIHDNSPRRAGHFVELNCAAIPENLFESELFGTTSGAFTGARNAEGKVAAAEGGTLFLDEVAELPAALQTKLLQLLQSRQYYPLGSSKVATANIRVIAASNADVEAAVESKRFREDLYHRLSVFTIRVPCLGERREDIGPLLDELAGRIAFEHKLPRLPLSLGFRAACEALEWPGNVRQLRNKLEQATVRAVAEGSPQIEVRHLGGKAQPAQAQTFHEATRLFQRDLLKRELEACGWDTAQVAAKLDVSRSQVYNLMKALQLERE